MARQHDYKLEVVRRESGLASLREEWTALHSRSSDPVPYTTHDWVTLCWQRHRDDRRSELFVVTVRADGRLVLVVPLRARRHTFGFRVLSWINSVTPFYSDLLLEDSGAGREAAGVAARYLATDRSIVRLRLNLVPEVAAAHELLRHLEGVSTRSSSEVGIIDLSGFGDPDDYLRQQPGKLRYDFRYTARSLAALGEARVEIASTPAQVDRGLRWLFETKIRQLADSGKPGGWLAAPGTFELFQAASSKGLTDGTSRLYMLTMSGNILAAELLFIGGGIWFLSKTAIDRSVSVGSMGTYLRMLIVMDAIRDGARAVDLMLGAYPWKQRMRNGTRAVASYRVPGFYLSRLRRLLP